MITWLRRIFRTKQLSVPDETEHRQELWMTDFIKEKNRRFMGESADGYIASFNKNGLTLSLERTHLFAWTLNPLYEYKDFVLEAHLDLSGIPDGCSEGKAGACAFGFLFRTINDLNYYMVLVSNDGFVRMDALFNGNPLTVLSWTSLTQSNPTTTDTMTVSPDETESAIPVPEKGTYVLKIIARNTGFTLILNEQWLAYVEDDTVQSFGKIAFAGQNWGDIPHAEGILTRLVIDSRPESVETLYYYWNETSRITAQARLSLAESYYAAGKLVPALIELEKAEKQSDPTLESLLLAEKMYTAHHLYSEAEEKLKKAFAICEHTDTDPKRITHLYEDYAALLYMQNRFAEFTAFFLDTSTQAHPLITHSAQLSALCAHVLCNKRNFSLARDYYERAFLLEPTQGLHLLNKALAEDALGDTVAALESRLAAAHLFLAEERYNELSDLIPILRTLAATDYKVASITAKFYYAIEDYENAYTVLESLCADETISDSAVWFLCGTLRAQKGLRQSATAAFQKAVFLEESYPLYHLRLAESLFLSGAPSEIMGAEIHRCIELDSTNAWAWNLSSQIALQDGRLPEAESNIHMALSLLPDEEALHSNAAHIYAVLGKNDDAFSIYDMLLKKNPKNTDALLGKAELLYTLGTINDADVYASQALEIKPSVRSYRIIAAIAQQKGEFARAEIAYKTAFQEYAGDADIVYDWCNMYMNMHRFTQAAQLLEQLGMKENSPRYDALHAEIKKATFRRIGCSSCDREWYVPIMLPAQKTVRLVAQPPDELPAGTCPECACHYCIGCAKKTLGDDGRFKCERCLQKGKSSSLKIIDGGIAYILSQWMKTI